MKNQGAQTTSLALEQLEAATDSLDQFQRLVDCGVCAESALQPVLDFPNFPLTGLFSGEPVKFEPSGYHLELMNCRSCGHYQLATVVPPDILYGGGYAHRSSESFLSDSTSEFFLKFVMEILGDRKPEMLFEFGCNDLLLLRKLAPIAKRAGGVDPIWIDQDPPDDIDFKVIGGTIETVDIESEFPTAPDLVISTHCLEHIVDPVFAIKRLMAAASENAMFIIEVPCLDTMVPNLRFDQVFHQHVHYYGLASLLNLIDAVGGSYISHRYNYRNWGGTIIVAFGMNGHKSPAVRSNVEITPSQRVRQSFDIYKDRMSMTMDMIDAMGGKIWGYGAGQMVPAVAYHAGTDFSFMESILDDNPNRHGLYYPNLGPMIRGPHGELSLEDDIVMITSLDAVRPIINRLRGLDPRYIIVPGAIF